MPLARLQYLSGLAGTSSDASAESGPLRSRGGKLSLVELYVPGDTQEIEAVIGKLRQTFSSSIDVRPVRRAITIAPSGTAA